MGELIYRAEELTNEQIENLYVSSEYEQSIIQKLKAPSPVLLKGSRGVGKSFLFRVCGIQMMNVFDEERVLPVFVTFRKASLLNSGNKNQFQYWMMGKICSEIIRSLKKIGKIPSITNGFSVLSGNKTEEITQVENVVNQFENSWKTPGEIVETKRIPSLDDFLDSVEDLCNEMDISRFVIFIDEAAHVFYPQQQRDFFTLFRDLRSPYIRGGVCKGYRQQGELLFHCNIQSGAGNCSIAEAEQLGLLQLRLQLLFIKRGRIYPLEFLKLF